LITLLNRIIRQMGTTNRELQERVLELKRMNRMQAVEIWQLKEERRVLEMKVESLLNADLPGSPSTDGEERHTTRRVSFGSVLFSDGEKREVEAVDAVEDVEEVEAVTLRELGQADSDGGWWKNGQLCVGEENQQEVEDPSKETFLEDSLKEVAIDIIEGEAERVALKKDSSTEGAVHEEECELTDGARSVNRIPATVVKGIQRIVCNADVDLRSFEGNLFTDKQPAAHSGGMEENPKRRRKEKEEEEEGGKEASAKEEKKRKGGGGG